MTLDEVKCKFPWTDVVITERGAVGICCYTITTSPIGDLNKTPLPELWNGEKMKAWRQAFLRGEFAPECHQVAHLCPFMQKH